MNNKEFSESLEKRTRQFAVTIIRLSASLPNTPEAHVIRNQVTKSGTSVGANYREANRARSKADFKNKIKISESEASETYYWLEVISEANFIPNSKLHTSYFSRGSGLPIKYPCIASRLSSCSRLNCASFSTPSAMTRISRLWATPASEPIKK